MNWCRWRTEQSGSIRLRPERGPSVIAPPPSALGHRFCSCWPLRLCRAPHPLQALPPRTHTHHLQARPSKRPPPSPPVFLLFLPPPSPALRPLFCGAVFARFAFLLPSPHPTSLPLSPLPRPAYFPSPFASQPPSPCLCLSVFFCCV